MPSFELVARRVDIEQREYPVGYCFPPRAGVVWIITDILRDGETVRHLCRVEATDTRSETTGRRTRHDPDARR